MKLESMFRRWLVLGSVLSTMVALPAQAQLREVPVWAQRRCQLPLLAFANEELIPQPRQHHYS